MLCHTVENGETLYDIAAKYRVSPTKLIEDNALSHPSGLIPGECLLIPLPAIFHTVRGGEEAKEIAKKYAISYQRLAQNNPALCATGRTYPGQVLNVSGEERPPASLISISETGLPFHFIQSAFPYLTYLAFSEDTPTDRLKKTAEAAFAEGVLPLALWDAGEAEMQALSLCGRLLPEKGSEVFSLYVSDKEKPDGTLQREMPKPGEIPAEGRFIPLPCGYTFNGIPKEGCIPEAAFRALRRTGGEIAHAQNGDAVFSLCPRRGEKTETEAYSFCDLQKEKALLTAYSREGFRSFYLPLASFTPQRRLFFSSFFDPVKAPPEYRKNAGRFRP